MGREIRRVPPGWKHPIVNYCRHQPSCKTCYQPMYDRKYDDASEEWIENFKQWESLDRKVSNEDEKYFWDQDGMPPSRKYYNTYYSSDEATWYQVYETVSEGTPVTPPFATREELVDYLVENGDFWYQNSLTKNDGSSRFYSKPSLEAATKFVFEDKWVPLMTFENGVIKTNLQQCETSS